MSLENYWNKSVLNQKRDQIKKIFFFRICGTGMGAAACLLKEAGFDVQGADTVYAPPMSDFLKRTGIPCHTWEKVTTEFLNDFDLIVVGNVVAKGSKDALLIEDLNTAFTSFPEAIGSLVLRDKNVVGISGTHGKTTTTYLMYQLFSKLDKSPGYLVGGVIDGLMSSSIGESNYFFIESDEYDSAYFSKVSKFQHYEIDHLVVTSLEFDHADIFENIEKIKDQFRMLFPLVSETLILDIDYQAINELEQEKLSKAKVLHYGVKSDCGPQNIQSTPTGSRFSLILNGNKEDFETNLIGEHNILNLTSAILFAYDQGFDLQKIKSAVKELFLVKRRQELRGRYKNALVIDDFAHHPRAMSYTISAMKQKYPHSDLYIIFEAASATARSNLFQKEFIEGLNAGTGGILVRPPRDTSVKGAQNLDLNQMVQNINSKKKFETANDLNELREKIDHIVEDENSDKILLFMGNGRCLGLWESDFVNEIV